MADNRPHISRIENYASPQEYKYPRPTQIKFPVKQRNRAIHGKRILKQLESIKEQFQIEQETELPEDIIRDDAIYVQFISEWGYELRFDQLNQNSDKATYQILNIKREKNPENKEIYRYQVAVMLTKGGISHFIKRVTQYLKENTKDRDGNITDTPKANELVSNIETIQLATLKAFWSDDPEVPFPEENQDIWWEVRFRKTGDEKKNSSVIQNLELVDASIGPSQLEFPEHIVWLVKGSANQLSQSVLLLDNLAELRKPQELADFITDRVITDADKKEWLKDLVDRTNSKFDKNSVLVCLLDTGVNNKHPLINSLLPDKRLYTLKEDWGKFDSEHNGGHGTGMAGLSLYGDLVDALMSREKITIYHGLESFKIYNPDSSNDPELYGAITEYACSILLVDYPNNPRVFCLAVTNDDWVFAGRPSSSSASIDKIASGTVFDPVTPQLVLVSGGNVRINKTAEYPNKNFYESIKDPGQAYNAITVGTYTRKDRIVSNKWKPLTPSGGMAPSNSTSATWEIQWPNKPDIVMEGGNLVSDGTNTFKHDSLSPLSIDKEYPKFIFLPFGDTSAAVALASKMAAELRTFYPAYWPETIRGLIIHSAEWTDTMLNGYNLDNENHRRALLRSVGYGVPILKKALYSADNSLTLISQRTIQPYRTEKSQVKFNEYHLYELPWPVDVLRDEVGDNDATLKVTLSYYIEPNPGNRQYATNFRYHSHELDFKLIKRTESLDVFKRRISAAATLEDEEDLDRTSEKWTLRERVRSKGSIKKDFITTSGVELSRRNHLAIYPKNGWYRSRKKLGKVESKVRYSLIVSIETNKTEVDLYTPVQNIVEIPIKIK